MTRICANTYRNPRLGCMGVDSVKSTVSVLEEGDFSEGGVVSTGGGTFLLEDTSFCGGVHFDLEEGV